MTRSDTNSGESESPGTGNIVDRFSNLVSRVAMLLVLVIVGVTGYEIVMRYVFSTTMVWTKELSVWLGAISYVLAGLYAMQKRAHIAITLLYDAAPRKVRLVLDVFKLAVIIVFSVAIIVGAGPFAWEALMRWETTGTNWSAPVPATVKPLIIVVIGLVALQAVANFVSDLKGGGPRKPDGAAEVD